MNQKIYASVFATLIMLSAPIRAEEPATTEKPAPLSEKTIIEAALAGKSDVIAKALEQGYKPDTRDPENRTLLMWAAFNGHAEVVKMLITAKADINAQDKTGTSVLMFAASGPDIKTVQVLLDAGAKINLVDTNEHFSALMWAAAEGQVENVKLLLKYKADITLKDVDGDTAESFAAKNGHAAVVKILKEAALKKETDKK